MGVVGSGLRNEHSSHRVGSIGTSIGSACHMPGHNFPLRSTRRAFCLLLAACGSSVWRFARSQDRADLAAAQEALDRGDAARAVEMFEALAGQAESLEAELGIVRAALRAGDYRRAVATANLVAAEHKDAAEPAALLAYIADRVARTNDALTLLDKLQRAHPDDWLPVAARAEILIDRLQPREALAGIDAWLTDRPGASVPAELDRLRRRALIAAGGEIPALREYAASNALRRHSWVARGFAPLVPTGPRIAFGGNGVVIDGGTAVLTCGGRLAEAQEIWVRNGLGEARRAELESPRPGGDYQRLRLAEPYRGSASLTTEQLGSPDGIRFCFVLSFAVPASDDAAYPCISPGIVVRPEIGIGALMQITTRLGPGHSGAPVFDDRGRLLGLGLASGAQTIAGQDVRKAVGDASLALRADRELARSSRVSASGAPTQQPIPTVEELFERLAPAVVQIVATA